MKTPGRIGSIFVCLLFLFSTGFAAGAAEAATREFVGVPGGLWSVDTNWNPVGTPASGDDLVFAAAGPATSLNDIPSIVLRSVRFDGPHTIQGARFDVTVGIEVLANAIIETPLVLLQDAAITGTATLTVSGLLDASGDFTITGATVDATNPNNSFHGGTMTLGTGATFRIGTTGALGSPGQPLPGGGAGVHFAGGTLNANGTLVSVNRLTGNGTLNLGSGPASGSFQVLVGAPGMFSGTIAGVGNFLKGGPGTLTFGATTTFNGTATVQGGELVITNSQTLTGSSISVFEGATLTYDVPSIRTASIFLSGDGLNGVGALRLRGGTLTQNGETQISATAATIAVAAPHQLLQHGTLIGGTILRLIGDGEVVLNNAVNPQNTIVIGTAVVPGPTLRLGVAAALGGVTTTTINAGGTLHLGGFHATIGNCAGTGRIVTGNGGTAQFLGTPAFTGTFHGAGNVIMMATTGPVTLAGTHTLSGTFDTQSPHLTVNGIFPAEVRSAGDKVTLAPGSITGPVLYAPIATTTGQLIAGDAVAPGGVLATGLNILGGAFKPMLSSSSPRISVNGAVNIQNATLDLSGAGATLPSGMLTLVANDGTDPITGTFSNAPDGSQVTINDVLYVVSYDGGDGNDLTLTPPTTSYHLSEGATGSFFDTDLLIANPWNQEIVVDVTFLPENALPLAEQYTLAPLSRRTIRIDQISGLESAAFSTIVKPRVELPIAVERTMRWDVSGYGGHTEKATSGPATTWYFAEGSEGFFRTFLLLANPQTTANAAHVTWLREGTTAIERTYELAPSSRRTIAALDDADLVNQAFGMTVTFDQPGVAERAMYFGGPPVFKGGHESAGVTAPSTTWLLAEGATGDGFETFILVANPGSEVADVTFTFLPSSGLPATLTRQVAGNSRITVNPEAESLAIPIGPVATQVTATKPVIAERAQYWPFGPVQWTEAHNSFGVTEAGSRWALAEGRVGGPEGYQTYILLANPGSTMANVQLDYLGDGQTTEPATVTVQVPPQQRVNVPVEVPNPNAVVTFGTSITSDQPIVVERAMYWNVNGEIWAAGTNATASRMNVP